MKRFLIYTVCVHRGNTQTVLAIYGQLNLTNYRFSKLKHYSKIDYLKYKDYKITSEEI